MNIFQKNLNLLSFVFSFIALCNTYFINAQEEILPQDILKKIGLSPEASSLCQTSKYYRGTIPSLKVNSYIDYIARKNLSRQNFELDEFSEKKYDYLAKETRDDWNDIYNNLMKDSFFFIKFYRPNTAIFKKTKIPEYISHKLEIKDEIIEGISLTVITPREGGNKDTQKLIFINTNNMNSENISDDEQIKKIIKIIDKSYSPFVRLVFSDYVTKEHFTILENETYTNWLHNRIIQDARFNSIFFSIGTPYPGNENIADLPDFDNPLFHFNKINTDILKTRNDEGRTLLFFYPKKCLKLEPNLYIDEYDGYGFSALMYQVILLLNDQILNSNQKQSILENIQTLIKHNIRLDIQATGGSNVIYNAIELNNPELITMLETGKNFYKALNQVYIRNTPTVFETPLDFLIQYTKGSLVKDQLLMLGAISGTDIQQGKNPLHVSAQNGNEKIFLNIIAIPYYQDPIIVNQRDNFGHTPLDYALASENQHIIHSLRGILAKIRRKKFKQYIRKILPLGLSLITISFLLYQGNRRYDLVSTLKNYLRTKRKLN